MRRLLMTAVFLVGLLAIAHPAHAQVDNQCPGGDCSGDSGGGYNVDSCAPATPSGAGYSACNLIPKNPNTGQPMGGVSSCTAVQEVIYEMGGFAVLTPQGFDPNEGQTVYNWQGYFGGWFQWQYFFGSGVCRNY